MILDACPFCGEVDPEINTCKKGFYAQCVGCGIKSPEFEEVEDVRKYWNKRVKYHLDERGKNLLRQTYNDLSKLHFDFAYHGRSLHGNPVITLNDTLQFLKLISASS